MKTETKDIFILCVLLVSILFIGAGIFQVLERANQEDELNNANAKSMLEKLRKTLSVNVSKVEFDSLVTKIREYYERKAQRTSGRYNWSYSGSLYFSASVVTTIGFGHMAPSTFAGRLFCIFYALLGIPLCLLTLKAMGERINRLLENLFILISSKSQLRQEKRTKIKVLLASTGLVLVFLLIGGLLYLSEDWSYFDAVYYCFIALCTIGFGDMVPRKSEDLTSGIQALEYVLRGLYLFLGLCLVSSVVCSAVSAVKMFDRWDVCGKTSCLCCQQKTSCEFSEEMGPRPDGLYSVSRGLDTIVFPSVVPFRRFASDEATPLINDPRWLY
ncbi:two pore potassium channel protein sup-9-like [Montipora capricornis]|uniref:two pore potassium channel protein sup-9-like n=1 Tax=Montipora capricornis TaxID=246305 RepID=UPI0035F1335E